MNYFASIRSLLLCVAAAAAMTACKDKSINNSQNEAAHHAAADPDKPSEKDRHADEIQLTGEAVQRYNIKLEPVSKHVLTPTVLAPARVSFNMDAIAHVGSPLQGRVTDLKVHLGETVKKGDPLFIIESPELGEAQSDYLQRQSAARTAGPAVDLAKSAFDRAKSLYDKSQGIALTEVQKREAEYRAAQAAQTSAHTAELAAQNKLFLFGMEQKAVDELAATGKVNPRLVIAAPMAGQVVEREVTLGELVSPGKEALLTLANLETLWVLADVPEARLSDIDVGAEANVTVGTGDGGAVFRGKVAFTAAAVDPSTRTAQVRIEVPDGHLSLRPGMFARVEIETTTKRDTAQSVLAVPDDAVQTVEGGPAVFVSVPGQDNTFVARPVKVGAAVGGMVPVLSGLKDGERVVVAGSFILKAELGKGSAGED